MIDYKCAACGAAGRKLWRQYNTYVEFIQLRCATCALKEQNKDGMVDALGYMHLDGFQTDQIGFLIPAVLMPEGDGFWGYTSVPQEDIIRWRGLPSY